VDGYKVNFQKSIAFLYTNNEQIEREYMETTPFTIASKKTKYLGVNLTKDVNDLYKDKYKPLRYRIMSFANRDILTVSLPICIPFITSSCLIARSRNSRTMLNRSGDSGHPCLFPEFRGNGFSWRTSS
jgi:hypothetical protein